MIKIATQKEFNNIWFRTGKDPDGNNMPKIVLGGNEDSYRKYLEKKQCEYNTNDIKEKALFERKIELRSTRVKYYIWRGGECDACAALDGEIFEEGSEPSSQHPNCGCTLEEVDVQGNIVKDGNIKKPSPWKEGSKSSKEILAERDIDYDERLREVRAKRNKEKMPKSGQRWKDMWDKSKFGKNKFSPYGKERMLPHYDKPKIHKGDDIALPKGTIIPSVKNGTVVANTFEEKGYGNYIRIKNDDGTYSEYGHMAEQSRLEVGSKVNQGDIIGSVGNTGRSTGNHLHYTERRVDFQYIEPSDKSRQYLFDFYNELF